MAKWELRFAPERTRELARRFEYEDDAPILGIGRRARDADEFSHEDFLTVCKWKSPRSQPKCQRNTPAEIREITRIALSTSIERLRIEVLQSLHGVGWPTASVLLHIAHRDPYPISDVRALWSWGFDKMPAYSFDTWWQYVRRCRQLAQEQNVAMRVLDRALWQYSNERQGALP